MPLELKNDKLLTTAEAAKYLGLSEDTIRRYVYRDKLAAEKFGHSVAIRRSECDRFSKEKRPVGRPKQEK
jgi:excisionase family DNA binding protein